MGKVDFFSIAFQKQNPIFFGGEAVVGTVNIQVKERFKINGVKLIINGSAQVYWTETETRHTSNYNNNNNRHTQTYTVTYTAEETYMNSVLSLMNKPANDGDLYLEAGVHNLPFNVILSPLLPTSFEHQFGKIRYSVRATIDIPWAFDKHTVRAFTVLSHYDLNSFPALRQAQGVTALKEVGCLCCKAGTINGSFATPKTGFVPGEHLQFSAKIENRSSRNVNPMTLDLIQQIRFHARQKTKVCKRIIAILQCPRKLDPQEIYEWTNRETSLIIPPIASTSNGTCKIIDISYLLDLTFAASGLSIATNMKIPIVIGTIPMRDPDQQAQNNENQLSAQFKYLASIFESTPDSGEEIKGEVIGSDGNTFKPFYPYYGDLPAPK